MLSTQQEQQQNVEIAMDFSVQAAEQGAVVRGYERTQSAAVSASHSDSGPLPEDDPGGEPTMMRTLVMDPIDLYRMESQVPRFVEGTITEEQGVVRKLLELRRLPMPRTMRK